MSDGRSCRVGEAVYGRRTRAVILENDLVRAVILVDKGADIYELVYKPRGVDVLWKTPWGIREPGAFAPTAANSLVAWMDHYEGGWQEILPSGGDACLYRGVEMPFHGEVATVPWDYTVVAPGGDEARVRFAVTTTRTPFRLERTMSIAAGRPEIVVAERLVNEGRETMDFMWGHHPAFGAPFVGGGCRLDVPTQRVIAYEQVDPDRSWLASGEWAWPHVAGKDGRPHDLSQVPDPQVSVNNLAYLAGLREGWYALTNTSSGFGFGMVWPAEVLPYVWLWQDFHGSLGYPWYGRAYVMGVEIWTSMPSSGLVRAIENGTARRLGPGQAQEVTFRCLFYESQRGVRRILPDGSVELQ